MTIRCLGGADKQTVDVVRHHGNFIELYTGSDWLPVVFPNWQSFNVLDCVIDGAAHRAVMQDIDYNIYARIVNGLLAIDLSQTSNGYGPDGATSYIVKAGDTKRRLIGGLQYQSGGVGLGIGAQNNNVGSYLAPLTLSPSVTVSSGASSTDTAWTTIPGTRLSAWLWGDAMEPLVIASGGISCTSGRAFAGISVDNAAPRHWVPCGADNFTVTEPMNANSTGMHVFDLALRVETPGALAAIVSQATIVCRYLG